jgi:hypothetical protein
MRFPIRKACDSTHQIEVVPGAIRKAHPIEGADQGLGDDGG